MAIVARMNAISPPPGPRPDRSTLGASTTSMRWAALTDAGGVVAALAGFEPEKPSKQVRNFPAMMRDCANWRRELADGAVADLAAIMEPGLAALLAVNARGADPRPAAQALWREFANARAAILDLLPPAGSLGPRRSA